MPWTDKPGGSGSGNNGGRGPWGQAGQQQPGSNNGGNGGRGPADIEELIRSGRDRFRRGGAGRGGRGGPPPEFKLPSGPVLFGGVLIIGLLWLATGVYSVPANGRAVVTTFGAYSKIAGPGLHWHLPWPVQQAAIVEVDRDREVRLGAQSAGRSSMLSSDLNIVDITMSVAYRVAPDAGLAEGELPNAAKFLFNIEQQNDGVDRLVRAAAESALRQVVGANDFEPVISRGRSIVPQQTEQIVQELLDSYGSGIEIIRVNFDRADPPAEVLPAQRDVVDARSQAEQLVNEATQYRNSRVPRAAGEARQIELTAESYAQRVVREANGQARRFKDIYAEYLQAPEVTRQRMYLETMEEVLGTMNKVVIDDSIGGGAVPYLNLNELTRNSGAASQPRGQ